jgi:hypothetical protein
MSALLSIYTVHEDSMCLVCIMCRLCELWVTREVSV